MKKLLFLSLLIFTITQSNAQDLDKRYCFEPTIGTFYPQYNFESSGGIKLYNEAQPGLKFGLIKNLTIGRSSVWVIRPGLSIGGFTRNSYITGLENESNAINYTSATEVIFQAPLHISQNISRGKAKTFIYFLEGVTYNINIGTENHDAALWLEKSNHLTLDFGTGIRFYNNRKHLFALELMYSYGIQNIKSNKNNFHNEIFDDAQEKAISDNISKINLHFLSLQFLF